MDYLYPYNQALRQMWLNTQVVHFQLIVKVINGHAEIILEIPEIISTLAE